MIPSLSGLKKSLSIKPHQERNLLLHFFSNLMVILLTHITFLRYGQDYPWLLVLAAIVAGNSIYAVSLATHELSHCQIFSQRPWLHIALNQIGWTGGIFTTSLTQWKAHNMVHHAHTNRYHDPDRRLLLSEVTPLGKMAKAFSLLVPSHHFPRLTLMYGFSFLIFSYHTSLLIHSLLGTEEIYDLRFSTKQKAIMASQFLANIAVLIGWAAIGGFSGLSWLYLGLCYFVMAWLAGAYIITNHLNCPLKNDPTNHFDHTLKTTVSLKVPRWIDFLHLNFSHHVEHHLLASAGYQDLPEMREYLLKYCPGEYKLMTWPEAIREITSRPIFHADDHTLCDYDGEKKTATYFGMANDLAQT